MAKMTKATFKELKKFSTWLSSNASISGKGDLYIIDKKLNLTYATTADLLVSYYYLKTKKGNL